MYQLPHFTESDDEQVFHFMQMHPFAFICAADSNNEVQATHIPVEVERIDGKIIISGHFMTNTKHHLAMKNNDQVLVIFTGPHAFVNAAWYAQPHQASTWNYMDVQVRGKIKFTDRNGTFDLIKKITEKYVGIHSPASFQNLSLDYIEQSLDYIIGFYIEAESVKNTFKLSQNKDENTRKNIIEKLSATDDDGAKKIAGEMKKRLK